MLLSDASQSHSHGNTIPPWHSIPRSRMTFLDAHQRVNVSVHRFDRRLVPQ